jgi:hypothetical protein
MNSDAAGDPLATQNRWKRRLRWAVLLLAAALATWFAVIRVVQNGWFFLEDGHVRAWMSSYRMAFLLLSGLAAAAVALVLPVERGRAMRATFSVAAVALPFFGLLGGVVERDRRWGWVLAMLPCALIVQHVVFVHLNRRAFKVPGTGGGAAGPAPAREETDFGFLAEVLRTTELLNAKYFDPMTLAIRYGVPAILVGVVGVAAFYALFVAGAGLEGKPQLLLAAQVGEAGAYAYVMLYLGRRAVRHDITSGGATWCAVVLALGPALAATIQVIQAHPAAGGEPKPGTGTPQFTELAVYFLAGLAPRQVANWLEEAIRRIWFSPSTAVAARTVPIRQLRGIDAAFEERLAEEDITDIVGMAMTDPLKLFRNTNLDKRLILSWMDEALLMLFLPQNWQALENEGVSGAIDLAWYGQSLAALGAAPAASVPPAAGPASGGAGAAPGSSGMPALDRLADAAKIDRRALADVALRLFEDRQVLLVWALYQFVNSDLLDGAPQAPPGGAPAVSAMPRP